MRVDFRIQKELKSLINKLAEKSGWSISEVASELAWLGIGIKMEGGIEIVGPFGLKRPFSIWSFGGKKARLTLWIGQELVETLKKIYNESLRSNLREAIQLGTIAFQPKEVRIKGAVLGIDRKLASVDIPKIKEKRAKTAFKKLQQIL